ncbi:solute carrier family 22 member 18 [Vombatus ursinus]|uniref:solute carrier family 22 member 18 n=1 Tax=Vombatus ursinus TaxID=29139 RepID=UPI000FFD919D|nr:solute carrier family 22 member 18 [Vombatus ursinus]
MDRETEAQSGQVTVRWEASQAVSSKARRFWSPMRKLRLHCHPGRRLLVPDFSALLRGCNTFPHWRSKPRHGVQIPGNAQAALELAFLKPPPVPAQHSTIQAGGPQSRGLWQPGCPAAAERVPCCLPSSQVPPVVYASSRDPSQARMQEDAHLQQGRKAQGGLRKETPASPGDMGRQFVLRVTYLLTAVEFTCLFMQFSILPYLAKDLGLDSVGFGYLQTLFGVLQLLGGPIFGRFADQWGARAALTLSFVAASGFYLLLSFATNVPLLVASRIPAMFMHALPGAQMVITDMTPPADRPAALGKLGLCFGIGIILGSLLGGTLNSKFGLYSPAYVAFLANTICTMISLSCIPANTKATSEAETAPSGTPPAASVFDLKEIARLLGLPGVRPVFFIKILSGFPSGLFMIMFSIISMNFFELEAAQAGYLMSYFGVLQMVVQGLVIGQLTERYSEDTLLRASVFVFSSVGLAMVPC